MTHLVEGLTRKCEKCGKLHCWAHSSEHNCSSAPRPRPQKSGEVGKRGGASSTPSKPKGSPLPKGSPPLSHLLLLLLLLLMLLLLLLLLIKCRILFYTP